MATTYSLFRINSRRLVKDRKGQDLVEYALLAAFVAVAAGAIFPTSIAPQISQIFSRIVATFALTPS
jgi:Flp pilus assembly pilin Flp